MRGTTEIEARYLARIDLELHPVHGVAWALSGEAFDWLANGALPRMRDRKERLKMEEAFQVAE